MPEKGSWCPGLALGQLWLDRAAGGAQFFCEPAADKEECVFRDDTLVLLEMTTRDMMEVRPGLLCRIWLD